MSRGVPCCRVIARSNELRLFLEERGELRCSPSWLALQTPTPTWVQGVQRLLKQIVGKEAITPAPAEAARATAASHDVVRSVREALHSYRSNQYAPVHFLSTICAAMLQSLVSCERLSILRAHMHSFVS